MFFYVGSKKMLKNLSSWRWEALGYTWYHCNVACIGKAYMTVTIYISLHFCWNVILLTILRLEKSQWKSILKGSGNFSQFSRETLGACVLAFGEICSVSRLLVKPYVAVPGFLGGCARWRYNTQRGKASLRNLILLIYSGFRWFPECWL